MPQPRELPGFYYDVEKNRYFPIKGPIPGSSRSSSSSSSKPTAPKSPQLTSSTKEGKSSRRKLRNNMSKLLQARELDGHVIASRSHNFKCNFTEELRKIQASQPVVWKYKGMDSINISALEQMHIDVLTQQGQYKTDVLLTGSMDGSVSFCPVGRSGQYYDGTVEWIPDCVKNYVKGKTDEHNEVPGPVYSPNPLLMSSSISCVRKCTSYAENDGPVGHALFTTLGSDTSGGSVYTIGINEPLDLGPGILNTWSGIEEVASFKCTLWTAEYDYNRHRAVIGTNLGAASVDLETGMTSWFLRCKSDVFAQQIVNSGNVILCGLRNGAIVTVDFRQKRERFSSRLITHRIPYSSSNKNAGNSNKDWFKLTGDIYPSHTIRMPRSISCLLSLQFDDQYFLASSMDGLMKLYDRRLIQRGALQSYEGHVNSHTRIQLGVDPAERFVMSGGEDCSLRVWSIKSGELLFEDKFSDSVLSTACFQTHNGFKAEKENQYKHDSLGAWLGSREGLFYLHWL